MKRAPARAPRHRPMTFGVYDEGEGMLSLYLHDVRAADLQDSAARLVGGGQVAVLTPGPMPDGVRPLLGGGWIGRADQLLLARPPFEAVLLDAGATPEQLADSLPSCLLAAPDNALPTELGARVALVVDEAGEAVVLSRQPELLAQCLASPFEHNMRIAFTGGEPPAASMNALASLIIPMEEAAWCELSIHEGGRYRTLTLEIRDSEQGGRTVDRSQWIAPRRGGSWRADWSW